MRKNEKETIYEKYREILEKPKLSDEEIDKMRKNIRLLAFTLTEHVLKTKINQIY